MTSAIAILLFSVAAIQIFFLIRSEHIYDTNERFIKEISELNHHIIDSLCAYTYTIHEEDLGLSEDWIKESYKRFGGVNYIKMTCYPKYWFNFRLELYPKYVEFDKYRTSIKAKITKLRQKND